MYGLFLEKNVIKYLSKLAVQNKKRLLSKIEKLKENAFPSDAKRIVNIKDKVFRIRVGHYRVLYRIEEDRLIVVFLADKRSRVYR